MDFVNNSAGVAGSSLYGGYVDRCLALNKSPYSHAGHAIFRQIFHFNSTSDPSVVSSNPVFVCFCSVSTNSLKPDCQNRSFEVRVYPGDLFRIPAVLVGQADGTVPGVIHSSFQTDKSTASLGSLQVSQRISIADCSYINYSASSTSSSETLMLVPQNVSCLPTSYSLFFD